MAWTQTQLDALNEALALGVTEVRYADGKTVKYRSIDEMLNIKAQMEGELGLTAARTTRKYASTSKGL